MAAELHQNDIGTQFLFTLKDENEDIVDISSASTKQIIFKKPNGSTLTKNASFYTDGTDGKFYYTTASGDLDEIGSYKIQGYVVLGANSWHTNYFTEKVHRNIG